MNELLTLYKTEEKTSDNGFPYLEKIGEGLQVFCKPVNVGFSEFYQAETVGYTGLSKVIVYKADYDNEVVAEFKGEACRIIRTYDLGGDFVELTLAKGVGRDGRELRL